MPFHGKKNGVTYLQLFELVSDLAVLAGIWIKIRAPTLPIRNSYYDMIKTL